MKYQVIQAHQPSAPDGLVGIAGDRLSFERRPSEHEGWLWCRNMHGRRSWVPEDWLRIEGQYAILLRDYVAKELTISEGELLTVELLESEWALCQNQAGEEGWVPLTCLKEVG